MCCLRKILNNRAKLFASYFHQNAAWIIIIIYTIQQTSSKLPANVFKYTWIAGRLLDRVNTPISLRDGRHYGQLLNWTSYLTGCKFAISMIFYQSYQLRCFYISCSFKYAVKDRQLFYFKIFNIKRINSLTFIIRSSFLSESAEKEDPATQPSPLQAARGVRWGSKWGART